MQKSGLLLELSCSVDSTVFSFLFIWTQPLRLVDVGSLWPWRHLVSVVYASFTAKNAHGSAKSRPCLLVKFWPFGRIKNFQHFRILVAATRPDVFWFAYLKFNFDPFELRSLINELFVVFLLTEGIFGFQPNSVEEKGWLIKHGLEGESSFYTSKNEKQHTHTNLYPR